MISVLVGTGGYVLAVLYGLITFQPLPVVFWRGLRILLGVTVSCLFLLSLFAALKNRGASSKEGRKLRNNPQKAASHYEGEQGEEEAAEKSEKEVEAAEKSTESSSAEEDDEFSPLDPPVLETEEEN